MNKTKIEWVKNPDGTQGYTWNPTEKVQVIWMCNPASFSPMYSDGLEVIGNIYENPELVES